MLLKDFYYSLPESLIAKYPLEKRGQSKLLNLNIITGKIKHYLFQDLLSLVNANDLIILNNTKVIPARLYGHKETGGKVEILIEKIINPYQAFVHCRASKRPQINQKIFLADKSDLIITIIDCWENLLKIDFGKYQVKDILNQYGHIPLPPYLKREDEISDKIRYQTVYAQEEGSVAAPTAGLHFEQDLLNQLNTAYITLHVGAGTFQSVRVSDIANHKMHKEYAEISEEVCQKIYTVKKNGGRIIAVGTTTVRTLETASLSGQIKPFCGTTDTFIRPGFEFRCVDAMITNFHLPESTLLMLVCAFGGKENVLKAYQTAIDYQYRFYSYGDAMFLTNT